MTRREVREGVEGESLVAVREGVQIGVQNGVRRGNNEVAKGGTRGEVRSDAIGKLRGE